MLKYNNGKFRIMQITDIQDTQFTSRDTIDFISAALEKEKPDLAVLTGDQVKSYGVSMFLGSREENIGKTIRNILKPLEEKGVPFTYVYGNHDVPKKTGNYDSQTDIYESSPCCVNKESFARLGRTDSLCIPVYSEDGSKPLLALYLIDNCGKLPTGGNGVPPEQMDWMDATNDALAETNGGEKVPGLIFQHIPVYEMYEILEEVSPNDEEAIEGNCTKRGHYYRATAEMKARGEFMGESIACPGTITEQFDRWVKMGSILGAYFGHDHNNCFTGNVRGIDLGYTPGAGFNVYGPDLRRGVRIFEFDENKPGYETYMVFYKDILGNKVHNEVKRYIYNHAPSSVDAAKPLIYKGVAGLAGSAALITASAILKSKKNR